MPVASWLNLTSALYDHLGDSLSSQRLAALELLALEAGKRIKDGCDQQEDGRNDQACSPGRNTGPLYGAHCRIDGSAHVVGAEFTDEGIELG